MIAQIFAVVIFLAMFILIITEVWERHIVTLGCALLTLILVFGICMHSPSAIIETLKIIYHCLILLIAASVFIMSKALQWRAIIFHVNKRI